MAIKLMGVPGAKLLDAEKDTQDFVLISHPVFFVDDLERYKATLERFLRGGLIDQWVKAPLKLRGREIVLALLVNLRWISNPLFQQYWSMTPSRLGIDTAPKLAVKYTVKPRLPKKRTLFGRVVTYLGWGFSLKNEMNDSLAGTEMWFDFYVQRYVDDRTPIENSKVEWIEAVSPLEHVAKIVIASQHIMSAGQDHFCENLSFSPWHCLHEHRPLGVVNRVRRQVYFAISEHRHRLNGVPRKEPRSDER